MLYQKGESVSMVLTEYVTRLEFLEEYVRIIEGNYQYHTTLLVGILGFVIAAAGASLYFLAKSLVNSKVDEQLNKRIEILKGDMFTELRNIVFANPQLLIYKLNPPVLKYPNSNTRFISFGINEKEEFRENEVSLDLSNLWKFYSPVSDKYFEFNAVIKENIITIYLKNYDIEKDGSEVSCHIVMLNKRFDRLKFDQ